MPATRKDRWRPENDLVTMGQPLHLTSIDNKFSAAPPKHPRFRSAEGLRRMSLVTVRRVNEHQLNSRDT
eukprot:s2681_g15.t1